MSLVRDFPFPMVALEDTILVTCSAIYLETTAAYTTGALGMRGSKTTVSALVSTGSLGTISTNDGTKLVSSGGVAVGTTQGIIINRLAYPLGAHYGAAAVGAHLVSTRGSTDAGRKVLIGIKLQHGDSSAGGDMADYSTANQPDDRLYFGSTVRTCDMLSWDLGDRSTGPLYAVSNSGYYDLRGAKKYLRAVVRAGIHEVTTSQAGQEGARVGATICFMGADALPPRADTTSPFSTSTST